MTSPAHYANAGLDDSNLPYEILLNIDGVEDEVSFKLSGYSV